VSLLAGDGALVSFHLTTKSLRVPLPVLTPFHFVQSRAEKLAEKSSPPSTKDEERRTKDLICGGPSFSLRPYHIAFQTRSAAAPVTSEREVRTRVFGLAWPVIVENFLETLPSPEKEDIEH
jgi:hypothetical protein